MMKYANRPIFKSIRFKLIFGIVILIVPLLGLLFYNNYYAMNVVRNQVANSNKSLLSLYLNQIDRNLDEVDNYLLNNASLETDIISLDYPAEDINAWYYFSKIRLQNKMDTDINNYKSIDLFFIYSGINQELITTKIPGETYNERRILESGILQLIQNSQTMNSISNEKWLVQKINNQYYLYHLIKTGNSYIGAMVESSRIMVPLNLIELGKSGVSLLMTDKYEPMSNEEFIKDNHIQLEDQTNTYKLVGESNDYLQVSEKSTKGQFSLLILVPVSTILERLPDLLKISSLILLGLFVLLPVCYVFIRKVILLPINRIVVAMRKVRDGYLEDRIELYTTSSEFELMHETFNTMISQITDLKINVYEEQLISQKAELKHLQLQINPHFFLNSLNIIYSLAQLKDYEVIQEMSLCLVQYLRFMFRSNLKFITLIEEIEHTNNYLRIQVMRFPENFNYNIVVADSLMEALVPPLSIQTFVENTIKYAVSMEERIQLGIQIERIEEEGQPYLRVVITDTGVGFPPDVLEGTKTEADMTDGQEEHIGIWNVRRRLKLLYQDQAKLVLSNNEHGGARVEIYLPLRLKE
ncbi:sensor histidine kinase [Paenibacillus andongensis]|uniref:sensor histidine kinase n=1 Tax=Paenibacillus andongensis TaxID=2975482 RepID=UPI0021BAE0C0|nr:histidine kinase [Paenibacillus andongensis]